MLLFILFTSVETIKASDASSKIDYQSSYRSHLMTQHLLPLMYVYKMNDIVFFIKFNKQLQLWNLSIETNLSLSTNIIIQKLISYIATCKVTIFNDSNVHILPTTSAHSATVQQCHHHQYTQDCYNKLFIVINIVV